MQEPSVIRREMRAYDWLEAECPDDEDHLEGGLSPSRVTIPSRLMLAGRASSTFVEGSPL